MARDTFYQVADFIQYQGNLSVPTGILRNSDIGRIEEFQDSFGKERIYAFMLTSQEYIWCDYIDIRPIWTTAEHLVKAGFNQINTGLGVRFTYGELSISRLGIRVLNQRYFFDSGFCIGDMSAIEAKDYFKDGELDEKKFFNDFPSVHNINDLIRYLKGMLQFDEASILL